MARLELIVSTVLVGAALAAPAMAREHHVRPSHAMTEVQANTGVIRFPDGRVCIPAPRVGAFATAPWTNDVPCEPYGYGNYGYNYGY
ncbi:hypothetical protein ACQR1W_28985 [Bradyrhizobium sp. HKCCYLS1011]|uniref:hypothetical protein n=1 Tax=Bradyrhizobium sp. HKCCYLS1011 TaxID=3420733 RepID=UPI003EBC1856